jgi:predicted PurR-regulated permease PerM
MNVVYFHRTLKLLPKHISYSLLVWIFNLYIIPKARLLLKSTPYEIHFDHITDLSEQSEALIQELNEVDRQLIETWSPMLKTALSSEKNYDENWEKQGKQLLDVSKKISRIRQILLSITDQEIGSVEHTTITRNISSILNHADIEATLNMLEQKLRELCEADNIDLDAIIRKVSEDK